MNAQRSRSPRSLRQTALKTAAAAAVVAIALTGCNANGDKNADSSTGTQGSTTDTVAGGTLTILTSATEVNWDPAESQNLAITTLGLVERRLTTWGVEPGKPGVVVPDLATDTGTVSEDGTTWTYTLKDGLFFEDGTPITSADIKYGIERSFAPELSGGLSYHKSLLEGGDTYTGPFAGAELPSIETPDDKTIVFHLTSAYGDWPWIVSQPAFAPVPEAKDDVATYSQQPVASGPYRVAETKSGVSITLERNDKWDKATDDVRTAGPDQIVFSLGQDATVTAQRLIADSGADKNAFGATFVPPAQLAQVANNASAKERLVTSDAGALAYLAINTERDGLDNVKVRQAIQYATDKQAFQVASGGETGGALATTLITPGIQGRVDFNLYEAPAGGDVDKAKALLAESGWDPASRELILVSEDDSVSLSKAQAIEQGLERAGFKVTIKPEAQLAATQTLTQGDGDYDLNVSAWQPDFPSANGNIQPLFDSSQIGNGGWNIARFSDPAVDALIAQATAEIDPVKAGAIWAQADEAIMAASPVVPLVFTRNSFLHGSNVENFYIPSFPAYPNYLKASLAK
ncbi:peptide/nickel transport system substrate-binding protein [Sanguibacter gelidistatuariae]|uniref:Peptide/nickel transport system substrate-binding protein n=1 Tax=Sanguibacter gelidistatuariae TaxID=1814289 RepID=A0A1G6NDQ7_9MICO|nr:ABC transporter substrate-binding protein [Sanguibacter gelidistatuariae]SDC65456.1 peptide/nickel transport system substrate-binding protein [Sanguibacter gelidistatuariae]